MPKRTHSTKSIETKYEAITEVQRSSKTKAAIAKQYGVPANTLSTWIKNKDKIIAAYEGSLFGPARKRMRTALYPELEEALFKWFTLARDKCVCITGQILQDKADDFLS